MAKTGLEMTVIGNVGDIEYDRQHDDDQKHELTNPSQDPWYRILATITGLLVPDPCHHHKFQPFQCPPHT